MIKMQVQIHKLLILLYSLPALSIGIFTMIHFQIPKSIWMTNLGIYLVCLLLSIFLPKIKRINPNLILGISIFLLLLTFTSEGISEVHRWIKIGRININVGLILSPLILIQLSRISNQYILIFSTILVSLIFLFQPDASQVTAFSLAAFLLLEKKIYNKAVRFILLLFIAFSWYNLDDLQPVNYVEGIVMMTKEVSSILMIFAIIALILIPLPFFMEYHTKRNQVAYALGVYFLITILSAFFGNFPVIIMGYGISPIIGYFLGIFWLMKNSNSTPQSE